MMNLEKTIQDNLDNVYNSVNITILLIHKHSMINFVSMKMDAQMIQQNLPIYGHINFERIKIMNVYHHVYHHMFILLKMM